MMADSLFTASHQSSFGLKMGTGFLLTALTGIIVISLCLWRRKKDVKRMWRIRSSFFHRKQRRIELARQQQARNGKPKQRTEKKHSMGNLIQRNGLNDKDTSNAAPQNTDNVNITDNHPSSDTDQSKVPLSSRSKENTGVSDGFKVGTNIDTGADSNIVTVDISPEQAAKSRGNYGAQVESGYSGKGTNSSNFSPSLHSRSIDPQMMPRTQNNFNHNNFPSSDRSANNRYDIQVKYRNEQRTQPHRSESHPVDIIDESGDDYERLSDWITRYDDIMIESPSQTSIEREEQ